MKRLFIGAIALGAWVQLAGLAQAQSTLDALDEELKEVKQQHDDATTQNLSGFFNQVDAAMAGSDAAVKLWQDAGGGMPAPTPVTTEYDTESASEREERLAKDKANADTLGALLQTHCGLLHYGAIFVIDPNRKGLQDDFNAWLQKAALSYPQLSAAATPPPPPAPGPDNNTGKHHRHNVPTGNGGGGGNSGTGTVTVPPVHLQDVMGQTMRDSLITKFLNFKVWKDKDQAGWSVKSIPQLFKADILDPSRSTPSTTTLANWDIYIAMMQADQPDTDKWTSTDYPPLQFERAVDDYTITPNVDKIEALVQIIHANPTHPQADDWLKRTRQFLDDYRAKRNGTAPAAPQTSAAPPPSAVPGSNVTVTTVQQGDAQIITTHTNAAPVNPQ